MLLFADNIFDVLFVFVLGLSHVHWKVVLLGLLLLLRLRRHYGHAAGWLGTLCCSSRPTLQMALRYQEEGELLPANSRLPFGSKGCACNTQEEL
jgi:hypothetical protein